MRGRRKLVRRGNERQNLASLTKESEWINKRVKQTECCPSFWSFFYYLSFVSVRPTYARWRVLKVRPSLILGSVEDCAHLSLFLLPSKGGIVLEKCLLFYCIQPCNALHATVLIVAPAFQALTYPCGMGTADLEWLALFSTCEDALWDTSWDGLRSQQPTYLSRQVDDDWSLHKKTDK